MSQDTDSLKRNIIEGISGMQTPTPKSPLDDLFDGKYIESTDTPVKYNIPLCITPSKVLAAVDLFTNPDIVRYIEELRKYKYQVVEDEKKGLLKPEFVSITKVKSSNRKNESKVTERKDYKLDLSQISHELQEKINMYGKEDAAHKLDKYRRSIESILNNPAKSDADKKKEVDEFPIPMYRCEVGETIKMLSTRKVTSNNLGNTAINLILDWFLRNLLHITLTYSSKYGKDISLTWLTLSEEVLASFNTEQKSMLSKIEPLIKLCTSINKPVTVGNTARGGFKQDIKTLIRMLCGGKETLDIKDRDKDKDTLDNKDKSVLEVKDEVDVDEHGSQALKLQEMLGFTSPSVDTSFIDHQRFGKLDQKNIGGVLTILNNMLYDIVKYIVDNASRTERKGASSEAVMLVITEHYTKLGSDPASLSDYVRGILSKVISSKKKKTTTTFNPEYTAAYMKLYNQNQSTPLGLYQTLSVSSNGSTLVPESRLKVSEDVVSLDPYGITH